VFVAHNVRFDWGFVAQGIRRARDVELDGPRICTVRLAKKLIPGLRSRGLDSVARYFGVEIENRHRAGGDAHATARVFLRLLDRAKEGGARTVKDLEALGARRTPQKRKRRRGALPRSMEEA
jgi:DNA polymerase III subunit epsilon